MVKEYILTRMEQGMKEISRMTCNKAKVLRHGMTDPSMKVNMRRDRRKGLENIIGLMGQVMKENGEIIKFMGMEYSHRKITLNIIMDNGEKD